MTGAGRKRFGVALRDLVLDRNDPAWLTRSGNVNWAEFAKSLDGIHYETLRKALSREREVSALVMEGVAKALGVEPSYFVEYELLRAQNDFDPAKVGYDEAVANLERWKKTRR